MKNLINILPFLNRSKKEKHMSDEQDIEALPDDGTMNQPVADEPEVATGFPVFEGKQVMAILDDGRETVSAYHCSMSDGTTMHVPKELFL